MIARLSLDLQKSERPTVITTNAKESGAGPQEPAPFQNPILYILFIHVKPVRIAKLLKSEDNKRARTRYPKSKPKGR